MWIRAIGSTLFGQAFDSLVFITIAFAGNIPAAGMLSAIVTQWLMKSTYEAIATPLTYGVVNFLKREEGMDVYDRSTNFNPLKVTE